MTLSFNKLKHAASFKCRSRTPNINLPVRRAHPRIPSPSRFPARAVMPTSFRVRRPGREHVEGPTRWRGQVRVSRHHSYDALHRVPPPHPSAILTTMAIRERMYSSARVLYTVTNTAVISSSFFLFFRLFPPCISLFPPLSSIQISLVPRVPKFIYLCVYACVGVGAYIFLPHSLPLPTATDDAPTTPRSLFDSIVHFLYYPRRRRRANGREYVICIIPCACERN